MHQQSGWTATPSRLIGAPTSTIPTIFTQDALPYTTLPIYPGLGQASNMLACILGGLVTVTTSPNEKKCITSYKLQPTSTIEYSSGIPIAQFQCRVGQSVDSRQSPIVCEVVTTAQTGAAQAAQRPVGQRFVIFGTCIHYPQTRIITQESLATNSFSQCIAKIILKVFMLLSYRGCHETHAVRAPRARCGVS